MARPGTSILLIIVALLVVSGTVPALAGGTTAAEPSAGAATFDPDSVLLQVTVQADGTASWRIDYRLVLDTENRTQAFESVKRDIEAEPDPYRARFKSQLRPAVRQAANETGRDMRLRNVSVSASRSQLGPETGVVSYTFEWTNFSTVEGEQLRVGDALSGFYVSEETTLLIGWPTDYRLATVTPEPDEERQHAAVWEGETAFANSEPRLRLNHRPKNTTTGSLDESLSVPVVPTTGAAVILLAGVLLVVARGRGVPPLQGVAGVGATDAPETAESERDPPPELLSNEERVLATLEKSGGRMKQQELAAELEWTDPKTSRVVHSLRDEGTIEVFRLGRENVISLPTDDP